MTNRAYTNEKGQLAVDWNGETHIVRKTAKSAKAYNFVTVHEFADGDRPAFTANKSGKATGKRFCRWWPISDSKYEKYASKPEVYELARNTKDWGGRYMMRIREKVTVFPVER